MTPEELAQRVAVLEAATPTAKGAITLDLRTLVTLVTTVVALGSTVGFGSSYLLIDAQVAAEMQAHLATPGHSQLIENFDALAQSTDNLADRCDDMAVRLDTIDRRLSRIEAQKQ